MLKKLTEKTTSQNKKVKRVQQPSLIKTRFHSVISQPILNVAVLVLLLLTVFGGLRFLSAHQVQGQVKFIEQLNSETNELSADGHQVYTSPEIFKGEVYDTSIRLREAGALGMAISLAIFTTGAEQGSVPPNLERIWSEIREKKLMPPGLEMKNGELRSPSGRIIVRYQAEPLRFEILSFPLQNANSPALLIRFPVHRLDGRTITYFQSSLIKSQTSLAPFASLEKMVSDGWTLEQWRGEIAPKTENPAQLIQEANQYLEQMQVKQ